jgi:hypothetical protein
MFQYNSPVSPFSIKGKILICLLRLLLTPIHWLKGKKWQSPPPQYNDDPRHFSTSDLLYFAYKYYYKSPTQDDADGAVVDFFQKHPPQYQKPSDFISAQKVTITAAGDLMPYEWIQPQFCPHLWDDIADDFFDADITFANLETPIDIAHEKSLVPEVMLNDMLFNADEEMFTLFNGGNGIGHRHMQRGKKGFDILSTANNHSLDMGTEGVHKTLDFLEKKGIFDIGTARNEAESEDITIIEKNGIRIAFIAYTFSMNKFTNPIDMPWVVNHIEFNKPNIDVSRIYNDVKNAKEKGADMVILSLHGGNAYQPYPALHFLENIGKIFNACGVDMILGGHPHNVQPMAGYDFICPFSQVKKKGFVLFSFGDFIGYDIYNWCRLSVYLKLTIEKSDATGETLLTHVDAVPVYACGMYRSHNNRDLRLLDLRKWYKLMEVGKAAFLPERNRVELRSLMGFYNDYFEQNLKLYPPNEFGGFQ